MAGIDGVVLRHRAGGGVGRQHVARVGAVGPGRAGDDGAAGVDGWRPGPVGARWGQVQRRGGAAGQAQQQGRPGQARQRDWPGWADGQARHLRQGHGPGLPGWVRWTGRRRRARPGVYQLKQGGQRRVARVAGRGRWRTGQARAVDPRQQRGIAWRAAGGQDQRRGRGGQRRQCVAAGILPGLRRSQPCGFIGGQRELSLRVAAGGQRLGGQGMARRAAGRDRAPLRAQGRHGAVDAGGDADRPDAREDQVDHHVAQQDANGPVAGDGQVEAGPAPWMTHRKKAKAIWKPA